MGRKGFPIHSAGRSLARGHHSIVWLLAPVKTSDACYGEAHEGENKTARLRPL